MPTIDIDVHLTPTTAATGWQCLVHIKRIPTLAARPEENPVRYLEFASLDETFQAVRAILEEALDAHQQAPESGK